MPKKLVLAVIDSLKPDMLDQAVAEGEAPALAALLDCGTYIRDCVSTFPSVTPVASAAIATGCGPGEHHIPSMNWFHRGEERYVEYGSSLPATRAFGIVRSLYDTVYNMNLAHLTRAHRTVFEHLDDAGLRTACTTYLIYRGRTRHDPSGASVYRRIAEAAQFRHPVYGARELFYADLFDSRDTGCTSALGMPGQRDRHTGCVGAYLVEHDLFDFLLFSLPGQRHATRTRSGPDGQVRSIAEADRALERIMHVAGGPEAFLEEHAVIVMSDHSQTAVESGINLVGRARATCASSRPATPRRRRPSSPPVPSARSAMVYALDDGRARRAGPRARRTRCSRPTASSSSITRERRAALVRSGAGELRFAPGDDLTDRAGGGWALTGDEAVLELDTGGGRVDSETYPDALGRLWSALACPHSGDVLASAELGLRVRRLGRRRPRGRRQPRLAPPRRLRGRAAPVRASMRRSASSGPSPT